MNLLFFEMASVILIYPIGGSMLDVISRRIPLGLLAVAAFLDKDGYDIKIIDQRVDKDWKKTLLNELKLNPICVGLSCSTGKQLIYAVETVSLLKKILLCLLFGVVYIHQHYL